jgi:hypothetical protein
MVGYGSDIRNFWRFKRPTVWLSLDDDSDSSPPQPAHWAPIYNVPVSALRRAEAEANEILNAVARPLNQSLAGLVKEDLRKVAVDQLLHGTGMYQVLVEIESILRKTIQRYAAGKTPTTRAWIQISRRQFGSISRRSQTTIAVSARFRCLGT